MLYGNRDDDVSYFVTASGLHIVTLTIAFRKLLSCFFEEYTVEGIAFVCIGALAYLTMFSPAVLRVLCFSLVRLLCHNAERKDRLGMSILLVLMIQPYMAFEMTLYIPVAFQCVSIFRKRRLSSVLQSFLILVPIQFYFLHQISLLSILLFPFFRIAYAISYGYAWLMVLCPVPPAPAMLIIKFMETIQHYDMTFYYAASVWWVILYARSFVRLLSGNTTWKSIVCLLVYTQIHGYLNPFAQVIMLDVGQGDCTLIVYPFQQKVIMIDAMGSLYKDIPKDIILPVLRVNHISTIDTLIVTHEDLDHSGGVEGIMKEIEVRELIDSKEKAKAYIGLNLQFLNLDWQGVDENENSIITYLQFYETSFLFMGDAGHEAEKNLLKTYPKLEANVLKVGHHGSKTSSSISFLHQLHPVTALISAGRNNRYHHPNEEVMQSLSNEGIYPLLTSKNGAVNIQICKYFAFFKTADNEFGIIEHR